MSSINKVILVGNLGRDPEVRSTPTGVRVCTLSVATSRSSRDKLSGERVDETEWHRVTLFDSLADVAARFLSRGRSVYIEGRLKTRKYTDRDGVEKTSTDIVATDMQMLGGRDSGGTAAPDGKAGGQPERVMPTAAPAAPPIAPPTPAGKVPPPWNDPAWPEDDLPF